MTVRLLCRELPRAFARAAFLSFVVPLTAAADQAAVQTVVQDRFNGGGALANHVPDTSLPNGAWGVTGSGATISGQRAWAAGADWSGILATIDGGVADGTIAVDWTPNGETPYGALVARATDPANYLVAYYWYGVLYLHRITSAGNELLASTPIADPSGATHRLALVLAGSSIQVWYDGVRRLSASDAFNVAATRHGFRWLSHFDSASSYANFQIAGVYTPPAATVTVAPSPMQITLSSPGTLTATAYDSAHRVIPDMSFSWTSSNPAAVAVAPTGRNTASAQAGGSGSATITAIPMVGASGTATVTVDTGTIAVLDTFSAPDATRLAAHAPDVNIHGATWSATGSGVNMIGNHAGACGADWNPITATIDSGVADGTIGVDWTPYGEQPAAALIARATNVSSYITAVYWSRTLSLYRVSNTESLLLAQVPLADPIGATHRLEIKLAGPNIEVWWDRVQQIVASDAFNVSATTHGFRWYSYWDWQSAYDRFEVSAPPPIARVAVISDAGAIFVHGGRVLTARAFDASNAPIPDISFSWTSSNVGVASVRTASPTTGAVVAEGVGRATVTATAFGGGARGSTEISVIAPPPPPTPPPSSSPPSCFGGVFPAGMTWPADGGIGQVTLSAQMGCEWSASSNAPWIIPLQTSGSGDSIVGYAVDMNSTGAPRTAALSYNGATFTISQTAIFTDPSRSGGGATDPCRAATVWPSSGFFDASGGAGSFEVTIANGCPWSAIVSGSAPWIHTVSDGAGRGSATFTVDAMSAGGSRSAAIAVGAATFTIVQSASSSGGSGGSSARFEVAPAGAVVMPRRISGSLAIMTMAGHGWTASSNAGWLSLWTTSGSGSATIWYLAQENPSPSDRTAIVEVGDGATTTSVPIIQHGSGLARPARCLDGSCEPTPNDCDYNPGGAGTPIQDPWCEDWPTPTDDPHCRKGLPRSLRPSVYGDGLECTEPAPIPPPILPTGIFAKAHRVFLGYRHTSVRLVPRNQFWWRALKPEYFANQDGFSNWFATVGAGPDDDQGDCTGDTDALCGSGKLLVSAANRCLDVSKTPTNLERLRYPEWPNAPLDFEDVLIARLLKLGLKETNGYQGNLQYICDPDAFGFGYNSNSFTSGLLEAAQIPPPLFPMDHPSLYPGWRRPIPSTYFMRP